MIANLDDTSNCPTGTSCISCRRPGQGGGDLAAETISTPVGVFCVTMCRSCFRYEELPNFSMVSAVRASLEHCVHLGITADDMEAAMQAEGSM